MKNVNNSEFIHIILRFLLCLGNDAHLFKNYSSYKMELKVFLRSSAVKQLPFSQFLKIFNKVAFKIYRNDVST